MLQTRLSNRGWRHSYLTNKQFVCTLDLEDVLDGIAFIKGGTAGLIPIFCLFQRAAHRNVREFKVLSENYRLMINKLHFLALGGFLLNSRE